MSDIDKDEKILFNSYRGKHIYMEDSAPGNYNAMWLASEKHHMIFCDAMQAPFLIDDKGAERHKLVDPNQGNGSSFQLIQSGAGQKIWLADSQLTPRIHIESNNGHEILLLDHDMGKAGCSPTPGKGKIQITTADKKMQIVLDQENEKISIQNHNSGGLEIYSKGDLSLKTEGSMILEANNGFKVNSSDGMWVETTVKRVTNSSGSEGPVVPPTISGSVLSNIETTEGSLINKFNPS